MYRYILKNGGQETVLLKDELKFAQLYIDIQETRFGNGLLVMIDVPYDYGNFKINLIPFLKYLLPSCFIIARKIK